MALAAARRSCACSSPASATGAAWRGPWSGWSSSAQRPRSQYRGAVVYPCREQVIEALPALLTIAGRLRSADPIDARGIARLNILLSDGSGPCYVRIRRNALTDALQEISQWLTVPQ